jgi:hypothetical protein
MSDDTPRAYTADEVRLDFLDHVRCMTRYWDTVQNGGSQLKRLEGLAFSILTAIDGCSGVPGFDLVVRPHEDDKAYHIAEGQNYYEDGMVINSDSMMHEEFYQRPIPQEEA